MISNKKYKKIVVLGAGGSGKTTLAKKLAKKKWYQSLSFR